MGIFLVGIWEYFWLEYWNITKKDLFSLLKRNKSQTCFSKEAKNSGKKSFFSNQSVKDM